MSETPAGFVAIRPGIYISVTPVHATTPQPDDSAPNVILIFGWMGALTRHLQSYSKKYTELYPHAIQIIVKCAPSLFLTSSRGQEKGLLPVVETLESLGCLPSTNNSTSESPRIRPRVLIHSFSNGGGFQLTALSRLLCAKYPTTPPSEHLVCALILDSSPAFGSFKTFGRAFSVAIQNPFVRYITIALISVLHAYRLTVQKLFGLETARMRYLRILLSPRLLPWMNAETPRLYVFSKKDDVVPWRAVQEHADTAKTSGLNVRCEIYEESAHVAHMRHDPKRYWASIRDIWQVACRKSA